MTSRIRGPFPFPIFICINPVSMLQHNQIFRFMAEQKLNHLE